MRSHKRGLFIVFEGINGSSKSSVIQEIEKYALKYERVKIYKFPDRSGYLGNEIDAFLKKEKIIDSTYDKLHLFSENRYAYIEDMIQTLEEGITILCDRYIYSAIAYQLPLDKTPTDMHIYAMTCIVSYFDKHCIKPDMVFIMDANFLNRRENIHQEKYYYEDTKQDKIRNYFKRVLSMCDVEYYVINPIDGDIQETACLVMNIIDNRYHYLSNKELQYLYPIQE